MDIPSNPQDEAALRQQMDPYLQVIARRALRANDGTISRFVQRLAGGEAGAEKPAASTLRRVSDELWTALARPRRETLRERPLTIALDT